MGRMMRRTALAGVLVAALAGPAMAQPDQAQSGRVQPPPTSPYADGTGNSAVDTLNSGQLDHNYTGPWHRVPPQRPVAGPIGLDKRPELRPAPPGPPLAPASGVIPEQVAPRR